MIERKTLHQRAYETLFHLIAIGEFPPGFQFDEQTLADRLGISRTPLRAAIARLTQEGLVVNLPYRGTSVKSLSIDEVDDVFRVRGALEVLAIRLAVQRINSSQVAVIEALLDECEVALSEGNILAFGDADARFHRAIADASGNITLINMLDNLRVRVHLFRDIANGDPDLRERTATERVAIMNAIVSRDGDAAALLIEHHIASVRECVIRQLRTRTHYK